MPKANPEVKVKVYSDHTNDPFICHYIGNPEHLSYIEEDIFHEENEFWSKSQAGIYEVELYFEPTEYGDYGVIEHACRWEEVSPPVLIEAFEWA